MPFSTLNVASPISHSLLTLGYRVIAGIIGAGAVAGLTTVMLVMFYGLSRVFYAMARDGLLPNFFANVHPKTKTPIRIIVLCGIFMAATGALMPISELAELVNVGTLFAFCIVCAGVIILRHTQPNLVRSFKTPGMPLIPLLGILSCIYLMANLPLITMLRFVVWMILGIVIYFGFSQKNSKLQLNED